MPAMLNLTLNETMKSNPNRAVIAIVDDDIFILRAMKRLVCLQGMDAVTFISGQEFIGRLEMMPPFDPDCVILDVHMPGLNGLQVQEHLTQTRRDIPVVFMTGAEEVSIREHALAAGAAAFLYKPFNSDLLIATLRSVLRLASPK